MDLIIVLRKSQICLERPFTTQIPFCFLIPSIFAGPQQRGSQACCEALSSLSTQSFLLLIFVHIKTPTKKRGRHCFLKIAYITWTHFILKRATQEISKCHSHQTQNLQCYRTKKPTLTPNSKWATLQNQKTYALNLYLICIMSRAYGDRQERGCVFSLQDHRDPTLYFTQRHERVCCVVSLDYNPLSYLL